MTTLKASDQENKPDMKSDAAENSEEREDAQLDHGIKESFPGSDPVSVKVSKYAPGDLPGEGKTAPEEEGVIPGVVKQAREAAGALSQGARATADDLLSKRDEYAMWLEGRIQRGRTAAGDTIRQHPVGVAVIAALIGCGVGLIAYEIIAAKQQRRPRHG